MQLRACIIGSVGALAMGAMTIAASRAAAAQHRRARYGERRAAATCWCVMANRCAWISRVWLPGIHAPVRRWWTEMDREGRGGRGRR
jgi:hypothetical protein